MDPTDGMTITVTPKDPTWPWVPSPVTREIIVAMAMPGKDPLVRVEPATVIVFARWAAGYLIAGVSRHRGAKSG